MPHPHHTTKTCRRCRRRLANTSKYGDPLGVTPPFNPRLRWAPMAALIPADPERAAELLGTRPEQIRRWVRTGIEVHDADRIAVRLGHTAGGIWGDEYWSVGFHDCPHRPDTWLDDLDEADEEVAA